MKDLFTGRKLFLLLAVAFLGLGTVLSVTAQSEPINGGNGGGGGDDDGDPYECGECPCHWTTCPCYDPCCKDPSGEDCEPDDPDPGEGDNGDDNDNGGNGGDYDFPDNEPYFQIEIDSVNSPVNYGETLEVDYTVENVGDINGYVDVELAFSSSGNDVDSDDEILVSAGHPNWEEGTLSYTVTDDYSTEEHTVYVTAEGSSWPYDYEYDTDTATVEVENSPEFSLLSR